MSIDEILSTMTHICIIQTFISDVIVPDCRKAVIRLKKKQKSDYWQEGSISTAKSASLSSNVGIQENKLRYITFRVILVDFIQEIFLQNEFV